MKRKERGAEHPSPAGRPMVHQRQAEACPTGGTRAAWRNVHLLGLGFLTLGLLVGSSLNPVRVSHAAQPAQAPSTATPTPAPSPTPAPPDPALAAEFAEQGKVEEAIGAYLAVIEQGTREERLAARLALAQVYVDDDQPSVAVGQLDAYLLE